MRFIGTKKVRMGTCKDKIRIIMAVLLQSVVDSLDLILVIIRNRIRIDLRQTSKGPFR